MVQGIGGAGESGSLKNLYVYNLYYSDYLEYQTNNKGSSITFEDYLMMTGQIAYFTQQLENYLESGDGSRGDGVNGNTLSCTRRVVNGSGVIYQAADEETYYQFDYSKGTYTVIHGNDEIAKTLGFGEDTNIDTINFGYKSANATDYTFGNLDDGQDKTTQSLNGNYGGVTFTQQEFDVHYILNALLMDTSDPQYQIAYNIFQDLQKHVNQWLPASDQQELNETYEKYGANSVEYKNALKEMLLKNLDQANEWIEDHTHVKNTSSTSDLSGTDSSTETGSTDGTEENTKGSVPNYDQSSVLNNAGLLADYTNNTTWKSEKVNRSDKSQDECRNQALAKSSAYASNVLSQVESSLIAQLGSECTDEIKKYIAKAKQTALEDKSWQDTQWHSAGLNKNKGYTSTCQVKTLVDIFFREFNTLCENKGKTSAEVAADQKAAEEKAAQEKSAYQSLYNMDMKSVGDEAGVDDVQSVNPTSAADIKAKAESEILDPIKKKVRVKLAGQGLSDATIQTILDNAATAALSDCNEWATTSNNCVYNINSDKLIEMFQDNVRTVIKNKGYDF